MRIAILGFGAESSTFSTHRMHVEEFSTHRGADLLALYDFASWVPDADDIEWLPLIRAHGGAGGPVERQGFEAFLVEVEESLRGLGPVDGVYVDQHGASYVDGVPRAEERMIELIRSLVGDEAVISLSMDTHGNFSQQLAEAVDLAVCFRHAPHIDAWQTRERAVQKLVWVLRSGQRPRKAFVRVPVLLGGERTSTAVEPAKTVFGALYDAAERDGIVDVSLWVGFAWADEDRNGAAVMVTGFDDEVITSTAKEIARSYWDARDRFDIVAEHHGPWDAALDFALTRPPGPLLISDSGDNMTAGSYGDITFALDSTFRRADVLESGLRFLFAGIPDPASLDAAIAAGAGARLEIAVGAVHDSRYAGPVRRSWTVDRLVGSQFPEEGIVAAVLTDGTISVLVQRGRSYFLRPEEIGGITGRKLVNHAWMPTDEFDVVVVKVGYLFPMQASESGSWFMAITPGGTDQDFDRLHFEIVQRPIFPLDRDFEPDLTPVLLPVR